MSALQGFLLAENTGMRPPTLNIFPSQPMHVEPPSSTKVKNFSLRNSISFLFIL